MQNLFAQIAIVQRTEEGLLLALIVKRDIFIIDGAKDGVPIMHSPTLFVFVDGPTAAYVESMDRLGLLTGVVFDYGEDGYRLSEAVALWRGNEQRALEDRATATAPIGDIPF
jgi:hypothetical protein